MKDNHLEVSGKTCCPTCGQTIPEPELSVEILEEIFDYNPLTGFVTFKYKPRKYFKNNSRSHYRDFKKNRVGKRAGYEHTKKGVRVINTFKKSYYEHRLIWALYYKEWPPREMFIDHINGDSTDNRIDNLRLVTHKENSLNKKLSSNNKSGVIGVSKNSRNKKWKADITYNNQKYYLGEFNNFDDAVKVRKAAEIKYGFHKNHGRNGIVNGWKRTEVC